MSGQRKLIDQATYWMVLIHSGGASEAELAAYRHWRELDPEHERICRDLEKRLRPFGLSKGRGLDSRGVRKLIDTPSASRREFLTGALCLGGLAAGGLWLSGGGARLGLGPDLQTGLGERRRVALEDGSQLIMNARTALDVRFSTQQRLLHLREGEILVQVSHPSQWPFVATTPAGEVVAQGDRLMLSHARRSRAMALDAPLLVRNLAGASIDLAPYQEIWFDADRLGTAQSRGEDVSAWIDGILEVRNRPLGDVVEAMRAYRRGVLRVSEAAAALRVSGRFHLDDSDQMLDALARALPVRLTTLSRFWVSIDLA